MALTGPDHDMIKSGNEALIKVLERIAKALEELNNKGDKDDN